MQQDQWKRKKQSKAESKAARRAKLDPDSELNRNAKEVMDQRAQNKRKLREVEQDDDEEENAGSDAGADFDDDFEPMDDIDVEKPGEGLKKKKDQQQNKKQKRDDDGNDDKQEQNDDWEDEDEEQEEEEGEKIKLSKKQARMAARTDKRREKKAAKKEREKAKKAEKGDDKTPQDDTPKDKADDETPAEKPAAKPESKAKATPKKKNKAEPSKKEDASEEPKDDVATESKDTPEAQQQQQADDSGASAAESAPQSPTFDTTAPGSASTSVSSAAGGETTKPKHIKIPNDTSALRARLAAKIEALRAARKADGPDGKPIRTRQELIESRRHKEAQRKAHKKEVRTAARLEEQRLREEALASNSPSVMSPAVELGEDDGAGSGNFAFGRVSFGDGTQLSHDLSYMLNSGAKGKKPPSDPKTALAKVQAQKRRLAELDDDKRKEIAEKEAWLTARRRAEGAKVHDNESLLKKSVKRRESAKRKSEKAWKDRAKGVEQAQRDRQRKRDENIRKRRDDKIAHKVGKKKKGGAKGGGGAKKSRPGFEGSIGVGPKRK